MKTFERFDPQEEEQWYGGAKHATGYALDYLYFFVGQNNLASKQTFAPQYLTYLKKNWNIEKDIDATALELHRNSWYFQHLSKDSFLELSRKSALAQWHLQNDTYRHQVFIFSDQTSALPELGSNRYMVKADWGFAGRGNKVVERQTLKEHLLRVAKTPVVVEAYLERIVDFSMTFLPDVEIIYQNQVSSNGKYLGTTIHRDNCLKVEKFLAGFGVDAENSKKFSLHLEKLKRWLSNRMQQPLQGSIDFFLYRQGDKILIHPGCEFNPRWTMGRVTWAIKQNFFPSSAVFSSKFSKKDEAGWLTLSPPDSKIHFLVKAE